MKSRLALGATLVAFALCLPMLTRAAPADPLEAQAAGVARWVDGNAAAEVVATGSPLFDQEWTFGAWQMAALGFLQHAEQNPASRAADLARVDACLTHLFSPAGRAFDRAQWGADPLDTLGEDRGHAAWLGYTNFVLSGRRSIDPTGPWAAENDALTAAIVRRLEHELLPETYPAQRYPVDVAAMVASVGLHARATGRPAPPVLARWRTALRERWIVNGVLVQAVGEDGAASDAPRGSGTFLAAWFLSRWDAGFAADLTRSAAARLRVDTGPLVAMREYPPGHEGRGDIDSGPIVGGLGVSSTGFAIGAARAAGELDLASGLERTATLFGAPATTDGELHWRTGAALGSPALADAILFAMMSTPAR